MNVENSLNEKRQLDPNFFRSAKPWWFNTSDFFYFYYVLAAVISSLLVLILLITYIATRPANPNQVTQVNQQSESSLPSPAEENINQTEPSEPEASPDQQALLDSAQTQPTYALKVEAYKLLLNDSRLSPSQKAQVKQALTENQTALTTWEKKLALAKSYMDKEYYSSSITTLSPFLSEGALLGHLYTEAEQLHTKAYLKKIDYFLIKGQITQAKQALAEARQAKVAEAQLNEYTEKIKNLDLAGR